MSSTESRQGKYYIHQDFILAYQVTDISPKQVVKKRKDKRLRTKRHLKSKRMNKTTCVWKRKKHGN